MGSLLETEDGLTADWGAVKRVCSRFDKRREWAHNGATGSGSIAARKLEPAPQVRREETREWLETGSASTGVIKGSSGGAALEELSWKFSSIGGNTSKESKTEVCIVAHAHALFVKY